MYIPGLFVWSGSNLAVDQRSVTKGRDQVGGAGMARCPGRV